MGGVRKHTNDEAQADMNHLRDYLESEGWTPIPGTPHRLWWEKGQACIKIGCTWFKTNHELQSHEKSYYQLFLQCCEDKENIEDYYRVYLLPWE